LKPQKRINKPRFISRPYSRSLLCYTVASVCCLISSVTYVSWLNGAS